MVKKNMIWGNTTCYKIFFSDDKTLYKEQMKENECYSEIRTE